MNGSSAIKVVVLAVAGVGLVGLGFVIGRADFSQPKSAAPLSGFRLLTEVPRHVTSEALTVSAPVVASSSVRHLAKTLPVQASVATAFAQTEHPTSSTTTLGTIAYATRIFPPTSTPVVGECHFETNQFPNYRNFVINEVAWMGTPEDSGNEWIELRNASDTPIEVSNYWLIDKAEQIKVHVPTTTLAAGAFYLLERGDDAVPSTTADFIYTGGLANTNEGLRLFDQSCTLVDQVFAEPKWPAGSATQKRSMERGADWNWYSYVGDAAGGILGTPRKDNTAPKIVAAQYFAPPPTATSTPQLAVATTTPSSTEAVAAEPPPPAEEESPAPSESVPANSLSHIVISSLQTTGGPGHTTEDFVELYNPLAAEFNLKGIRLVKRTKTGTSDTSLKSWTADTFIPAGGYYLWANSAYTGGKRVDVATSGSIADDNAVALRQGGEDTGLIIDAVGWGQAANALVEGSPFATNPTTGQLLVRKQWVDTNNNSSDFQIQ